MCIEAISRALDSCSARIAGPVADRVWCVRCQLKAAACAMPGAASCQPAAVALPPARFRAPAEPNASKSAIPEAPVPLGLPPPRVASKAPRRASEDSKASYDAGSSSSCAQKRASDTAPATNRCQVPAGSSQQQQKAPSIMELVNAAARKEEKQEALVRAGKR